MRFESQFTVALPAERVWSGLLDIERVAACLPGATLEAGNGDGLHRGSITMKVGAMRVSYTGTARLADVDEDTRSASIAIKARERDGVGTASATIRNHVEPVGPGTSRVTAETDLRLTGRIAQLGGGMVQEVAARLLDEFARRFERALTEEGEPAPALADEGEVAAEPGARATAPDAPPAPDEAFDVGRMLAPMLVRPLAVAALALWLLGLARVRRGRAVRVVVERAGLRITAEQRW